MDSPSINASPNLDTTAGLTFGLDINPLEELDPSLTGGFHTIFDREIPIELRSQAAPSQAGSQEAIKVKVLLAPEGQQGLRIELTSESDLFFLFITP
ncbi:hypothetical protein GEMRC1_000516 [Eukaryota sp. GEM-RC1]